MAKNAHRKRFLLVSIQPRDVSDEQLYTQMEELQRLVESYGSEVAGVTVQPREVHDKGLYIGTGKINEVAEKVKVEHIDVVVLNGIIKPGHLFEISQELRRQAGDVLVWDRVDLILQIFGQHAQTAEARLQIELASMRHMGPRIYGMGTELSRQGGGIGGRGIGETNTELMQRHWQSMMNRVQAKLEKLSNARERQMQRRKRMGLPTVSLVGYTNAGKTSLFNALTNKQKFAHDLLFATLDAATGKIYIPSAEKSVLISDTIGFIDNLPAELIEAFKSTLMEAINADLLVKVVDAADPNLDLHLRVVDKVLEDLGLSDRPMLYVFNKIDAFPEHLIQDLVAKYDHLQPSFISVKNGNGLDELKDAVGKQLSIRQTL
jgi:GTPase